MKKMSKLLALLLALAMVFSLVACSAIEEDDDKKKDDEGSSNVDSENKGDKDEEADKDDKEESDKADESDKEDKEDKEEEPEEAEPTDEELLAGEWVYQFDLSDYIADILEEETGESSLAPSKAFYMDIVFEFDDGQFIMSAEIDKKSSEAYMDALVDNVVDYVVEMAEDQGMSKEELEQQAEDEFGMSLKEYAEALMAESMGVDFDELSFEADPMYYLVDADAGRIYVAEDEDDLADSEQYIQYTIKNDELTVKKLVEEDGELTELDMGTFTLEMPWVFEKN